jgi:hypothetical protein
MAVYNPPTKVTVVEIPFESLVRQVRPRLREIPSA